MCFSQQGALISDYSLNGGAPFHELNRMGKYLFSNFSDTAFYSYNKNGLYKSIFADIE